MIKTVVLSDGLPCEVRQLGLFELDGMASEILGPYRYSILTATGQIIEDEYDLRALTYTPQPPDMPLDQIKPNSNEYKQQRDYDTYLAALAHEKERFKSYENYVNEIAAYIATNCVSQDDSKRLVSVDDWRRIYAAALVPQLNEEGLAQCLRQTFQSVI